MCRGEKKDGHVHLAFLNRQLKLCRALRKKEEEENERKMEKRRRWR
jgi:hypothetical protein